MKAFALISDLIRTSGLSSPLAGRRRLRFSFFANDPVLRIDRKSGLVAQLVRARA